MSEIPKAPPGAVCEICCKGIGVQEHLGGSVKHGGIRYVHKECWEREQAENKRRSNR